MSHGEWVYSSISLCPLFQFLTSGSFLELLYQLPSVMDWNLAYRSHINSFMTKLFLVMLIISAAEKKKLEHKSFKTKCTQEWWCMPLVTELKRYVEAGGFFCEFK